MIKLQPSDFNDQLTPEEILHVSSQLGEHGLIKWVESRGMHGLAAGMGTITADGVDVVEGERRSPIAIHIADHSVNVSGSMGVNVGSNIQQTLSLHLQQLVREIDNSSAPAADRQEAKSRLAKFLEHPLVCGIVGGAVAGLSGQMGK
jgi:hypothetical protein